MKNLNIDRKKIYDGTDDKLPTLIFQVKNINFRLSDFYNNPLRDLQSNLNSFDFEHIVNSANFSKKGALIVNYFSIENLEVYYCVKDSYLYIFSFGEYQPSRYMLFLESIWEL